MQGISERHVGDEIAAAAMRHHAFDGAAGDGADPFLELSEIDRHEPGLRQRPVFRMVGRVHLDQRAHQIRLAGDPARPLLDRLHRQRRRPVRIVKQLVLPADGQDMRMLGDDPERIETLRPGDAKRIVGPQPAIGIMQAMIGVGGRVDEGCGNVGRNIHGVSRIPQKSLQSGIISSPRVTVNRRADAGSPCQVTDSFGISRQPSSILAFSG